MRIASILALTGLILCPVLPARAADPAPLPPELVSQLDQRADLPGLGEIAYRAPLAGNGGPVIVLVHGVYGGSTHRAFREILPLLDARGHRVFVLDLLGAGESERIQKKYSIRDIERTIDGFLKVVVQEPAAVVAESVSGVAALQVAKSNPMVDRVVLLSPTGIRTLSGPGNARESELFDRLWGNEQAGLDFYRQLLAPESVRKYLERAYYDDSLVDDLLVRESSMGAENLGQRWLTLSFVGGKIYRPFRDASRGVKVPVLAIFGAQAEAIGENAPVENPDEFAALRPEFQVRVVPEAGASVQREKPETTASLIGEFLFSGR